MCYPEENPKFYLDIVDFVGPHEYDYDEVNKIYIRYISKASGIPSLSSKILKISILNTIDCFHHIINRYLSLGVIPEVWNLSTRTPIPKKGNIKFLRNIRPILILPLAGEILENILNRRLVYFLVNHDILCRQQGGFRRAHSTIQSCYNILNHIFQANNQG